jgi:hypothetical protein
MLISLSIEVYYLWSKNTVFWDAFTVVSTTDALWDFIPCSSSYTEVLANVLSPSSGFLRLIGFHSCYPGITVDQPLHRGILFMVKEHCLLFLS